MCKFCEKVQTYKEILEGYFTDEELIEMAREMEFRGNPKPGDARCAAAIMAVVEMAMDNGLTLEDIREGVLLGYSRKLIKNALGSNRHP